MPLGAEPADGDALIRVVRDQIGKGADFIKVYADYRWGPNGAAQPTFLPEELELMVEYGMKPLEVLRSATSGKAEVFHLPELGRIQKGFLADIIAVQGNPLSDISSLRKVRLVMKDRVVYKRP